MSVTRVGLKKILEPNRFIRIGADLQYIGCPRKVNKNRGLQLQHGLKISILALSDQVYFVGLQLRWGVFCVIRGSS